MILIVAPEAEAVAAVLALHGWDCRIAADVGTHARATPELVICCVEGSAGARVAYPLVPIVALADAGWIAAEEAQARACDDVVDRARLHDDLALIVADWMHAERLALLDRLAAAFGEANIATLLDGLENTLEAALRETDDAMLAADAHRIAGLAGTLGFARLGRQWLCVAHGQRPITPATRRATAHALATIGLMK